MGSKLYCGDDEVWLDIKVNYEALMLKTDGVSLANLKNACNASMGLKDGAVLTKVLTKDVYEQDLAALNARFPGRVYVYAFDWRKNVTNALAGLDAIVERARAAHGGAKARVIAHSMGGLVTRAYVNDPARAAKLSHVVTVGTPYWGSPKSLLPLARGETEAGMPSLPDLDTFLSNENVRKMSVNFAGPLRPDAVRQLALAGRRLVPPDRPQDDLQGRRCTADAIAKQWAGEKHAKPNAALYKAALNEHRTLIDGFKTNGVAYLGDRAAPRRRRSPGSRVQHEHAVRRRLELELGQRRRHGRGLLSCPGRPGERRRWVKRWRAGTAAVSGTATSRATPRSCGRRRSSSTPAGRTPQRPAVRGQGAGDHRCRPAPAGAAAAAAAGGALKVTIGLADGRLPDARAGRRGRHGGARRAHVGDRDVRGARRRRRDDTVSGRRLTIKQRPLVNSLAGAESAYGLLTGKVTHRGRRGQARQPHHQGQAARHWSSRAQGCASGAPAAARPCASAARDRSGVAATMVEVGKAKPKRVTRSPRNPLDPAPRRACPLPVAGHLRQPREGAIAAGPSLASGG